MLRAAQQLPERRALRMEGGRALDSLQQAAAHAASASAPALTALTPLATFRPVAARYAALPSSREPAGPATAAAPQRPSLAADAAIVPAATTTNLTAAHIAAHAGAVKPAPFTAARTPCDATAAALATGRATPHPAASHAAATHPAASHAAASPVGAVALAATAAIRSAHDDGERQLERL